MAPITLDAWTLEKLISAAVAAPSIHNTQPWRFRLDPESATVEVHAAEERLLACADADGRAMHLSIGAAVLNLRVAVTHLGRQTEVRLLPDATKPGLMASIRLLGPTGHTAEFGNALYDAIWRRHSTRLPFTADHPPEHLLNGLCEAAGKEGAGLHFADLRERTSLLNLTSEAEWLNHTDRPRREESRQWIRDDADDGLPRAALGPQDTDARMPMRDFSSLQPAFHRPPELFETDPLIAVLTTTRDGPADWLRAGQALERVLLLATADGLATSLLHQPLEWPDLRWQLRDTRMGPAHVQMLVRLGYGPAGRPTPRRPVREVLDVRPHGTL